jgi:uncharacterized protein
MIEDLQPAVSPPQRGLHVLAKPIGPICNLNCRYCFYLSKQSLYAADESWRMTDATLEAYVRQTIAAQPESVESIDFAFQGGEPTLMGLDFFRRLVELQQKYVPPGKRISNALQTNGILLDEKWCEFLKAHGFLVGVSIDGPADLHDVYRRDHHDRPTFAEVKRGLDCLRKHAVPFNALCCVHRVNGDHPARVYRFLRDAGIDFLQFIPIVQPRLGVARHGNPGDVPPETLVSPASVLPQQYGRFLREVFELWAQRDVGRIFVRDFDQALAAWLGAGPTLCIYSRQCGRAVALEHNGDVYSCDHFVEPDCRLGNIHEAPIADLINSARQEQFGRDKETTLPDFCRRCPVRFVCNGGCPKDRFLATPDGRPGLNYLCAGYRAFFEAIDPTMRAMAAEVQAGGEAAAVMRRLRAQRRAEDGTSHAASRIGRNDSCPCGSGRKFKQCCMRLKAGG